MAQKITPNLWFDGNAQEAAEFYTKAFPGGKIINVLHYPKTAEEGLADFQLNMAGKVLTVEFELAGMRFVAINAGPEFKFNPSVSFFVNFDPSQDDKAREHLDELWEKLSDGGQALMQLQEYPFSKHYGWVQDRYGLSWQLILTNPEGEPRPMIVPSLLFTGPVAGRAEEALKYYQSVFENSKLGNLAPYEQATGAAKAGALMYGEAELDGVWLAAMDSGNSDVHPFNEAVSLSVECQDQAEIDRFWEALSDVPEAEQCGWCKDKFGVSWQVAPKNTNELLKRPGAFANMMKMKKLVIADF